MTTELISNLVTKGFNILTSTIKSPYIQLNIKPTYKQRMFNLTYPYLSEQLNQNIKQNPLVSNIYLKVLMKLFITIPYTLMKNQVSTIIPIILRTTNQSNPNTPQDFDILVLFYYHIH